MKRAIIATLIAICLTLLAYAATRCYACGGRGEVVCGVCKGTGCMMRCFQCKGTGIIVKRCAFCNGYGHLYGGLPCVTCGGLGWTRESCWACNGTGCGATCSLCYGSGRIICGTCNGSGWLE